MRFGLPILALAACFAACVPNRMYRSISVEEEARHTVAFIEFDDQGEMWAPVQLSRALERIEEANAHPKGAMVILFVHGWQHNASPQDGNVVSFKGVLDEMAELERRRSPDSPRPLIGVYLGWRGRSGAIPKVRALTFYNRANAARRVAGTSATEAIYSVLATAKRNPATKAVVIGHSFGGQIVERALTQALVATLLASRAREIDFPADFVVLVNPAAKSLAAKQFIEMLDRNRIKLYRTDDQGQRFSRPLVVSVTSEMDLATRLAFPAGLMLSSLGKNFRKYGEDYCAPLKNQRRYYRLTAGHNRALHNFVVTAQPLPDGHVKGDLLLSGESLLSEYDRLTGDYSYSFDGEKRRFTIKRLPRSINDTPYWIMQVPRSLIPDHSSVFGTDALGLMGALFSITGAIEASTRTIMVREDGVRPLAMAVLPSGEMIFVDRTRRSYAVGSESDSPIFRGCLPQVAQPGDMIGFASSGDSAVFVANQPEGVKPPTYRTEVRRVTVSGGNLQPSDPVRIPGVERFAAAAVDLTQRTVFLATGDSSEVFVADTSLRKRDRYPRLLATVPGSAIPSVLFFHPEDGRLYAADGARGILYRAEPYTEEPAFERIADSLGWPAVMVSGAAPGAVYMGDRKDGRIWELVCTEDGCPEPRVFAEDSAFASPEEIVPAADGGLWVGDPEAQKIFLLSAAGEIVRTIERVPTH